MCFGGYALVQMGYLGDLFSTQQPVPEYERYDIHEHSSGKNNLEHIPENNCEIEINQ